ncbi:nucleotidyltransferase domain-containing protein [Candidatus Daviesbacteria bacterium]|nr:nucleotidyltransferase domain-containing protein [Candidatus Daviesbacteria bacterium]
MIEIQQSSLYKSLVRDLEDEPWVLGMFLTGSHIKSAGINDSDCDIYIIVKDKTLKKFKQKAKDYYYEKYEQLKIDLSNRAIQEISKFEKYALVGTSHEWDRYNLLHAIVEIDKSSGCISNAGSV